MEARDATQYPGKLRTAPTTKNHLAHTSVVPGLGNLRLYIKELDSFPKIKDELCEKAGRIGPQGGVRSAFWLKPISLVLWANALGRVQSFRMAIKRSGKKSFP